MSEATADVCVRVECLPHATDAEGPVRLLVLTESGTLLGRVSLTPAQASASARGLVRILDRFLPSSAARRIGDGLQTAAVTVWAARN